MSGAVHSALLLHLHADSGLAAVVGDRIYPGQIPPKGAAYPLVLVSPYSTWQPRRTYGGGGIAFEEGVFLVKVVDEATSPARARELQAALKEALEHIDLPITGYRCGACYWVGDVPAYDTYEGGRYYQHCGTQIYVMAEATDET